MEPVAQIQVRSTGEWRDKRTISLGDESGLSLQATVWGPLAASAEIEVGKVLAVKGARVSEWGGKSLNISDSQCCTEFNPKHHRTQELLAFFEKNGSEGKFEAITQVGGRGGIDTERLAYSSIS